MPEVQTVQSLAPCECVSSATRIHARLETNLSFHPRCARNLLSQRGCLRLRVVAKHASSLSWVPCLSFGTKITAVGFNILQTELVCLQQRLIVHAYQCYDTWRCSAMVRPYEHLVPHGNRFADHFGDGRVKSLVLDGMQVVDVRCELDFKALSLKLDLRWEPLETCRESIFGSFFGSVTVTKSFPRLDGRLWRH
jgi:hypothetical protein